MSTIRLGGRACSKEDAAGVLANHLETLPSRVYKATPVKLGHFRGLGFELLLHPDGPAKVVLEGACIRTLSLSKDQQGACAILNAAEWIVNGYPAEAERTRKELALAETHLRDYQARQGAGFQHGEYLRELTGLRDQLRDGLSAKEDGDTPNVDETARKIKELKESHCIEATPQRNAAGNIRAAEALVSRIRGRITDDNSTKPSTFIEIQPTRSFQERENLKFSQKEWNLG